MLNDGHVARWRISRFFSVQFVISVVPIPETEHFSIIKNICLCLLWVRANHPSLLSNNIFKIKGKSDNHACFLSNNWREFVSEHRDIYRHIVPPQLPFQHGWIMIFWKNKILSFDQEKNSIKTTLIFHVRSFLFDRNSDSRPPRWISSESERS